MDSIVNTKLQNLKSTATTAEKSIRVNVLSSLANIPLGHPNAWDEVLVSPTINEDALQVILLTMIQKEFTNASKLLDSVWHQVDKEMTSHLLTPQVNKQAMHDESSG